MEQPLGQGANELDGRPWKGGHLYFSILEMSESRSVVDEISEMTGSRRFYGSAAAILDSKFRILLPKHIRERLGKNFVMSWGDSGCINAHPMVDWNTQIEPFLGVNPISQGRRDYDRLVLRYVADDVNWDETGRITVDADLRKAAKLIKDVMIVGRGTFIEIWAKEEFEIYDRFPNDYARERRSQIAEAIRLMKLEM